MKSKKISREWKKVSHVTKKRAKVQKSKCSLFFFFYISGLMHREFVPANKTVAAFYVHFEKFT